jgi:hypothetical protein
MIKNFQILQIFKINNQEQLGYQTKTVKHKLVFLQMLNRLAYKM